MQELLKYISPTLGRDAISDCAKNIKELNKLRRTYQPELIPDKAMFINLKA